MSEGTDTTDVVRTRRLEVVDEEGRVRMVCGSLDTPDPRGGLFGFALLDGDGRTRMWAAIDEAGPALVFDMAGNNVITMGVNDPTSETLTVGPYLHLADVDGTPVYGWRVEEDGSVQLRLGGPTR
jgi:hypothetical protein